MDGGVATRQQSIVAIRGGAVDPITGAGVPSNLGWLYYNNASAVLWHKTSSGDTDWTRIVDGNGTNGQVAVFSGGSGDLSRVAGVDSINVSDATTIYNAADPTKKIGFDASIVTAGSTRVLTMADRAIDLDYLARYFSAGVYTFPSYVDNGDGSITVGSDGVYVLHSTSTWDGSQLQRFKAGSVAGGTFTLTDADTNYVVVSYNSGSPVMSVITNVYLIQLSDVIPIWTIYRDGTMLYKLEWPLAVGAVDRHTLRMVRTNRFANESQSLLLTESATQVINVSAGRLWYGITNIILNAVASSTANACCLYYHSAGVWTQSFITQYDNTQYDDGTTLQTLSNNRYAVNWIYRCMDASHDLIAVVLGGGNYTLLEAQASSPPTPPEVLATVSVLVGRIIVKKSDTTATQIDSAFETTFEAAAILNHNDTAGKQGGTIDEYYHLTAAEYSTNVTGPVSSINNNVALFDGITGKIIKDNALVTATITNTTDASSISTGCLVLSGGLGVAKQLFVGSNLYAWKTWIDSERVAINYNGTGARTSTVYFYADDSAYGYISQESTSAGRLLIASPSSGYIETPSKLVVSNTTDSSNIGSGAVVISGGIGITKKMYIAGVINSTIATGTAPLSVSSTTACTNLNADLLDGNHAAAFAAASHTQAESTITFTDITTGDVSITAHGYCPKAPNSTTQYLRGDGTWATISSAGDVTGPASSVDNNVVLFDGVTGKKIKDNAAVTAAITNATDSSSISTGCLVLSGGLGVAKNLYVGTSLHAVSSVYASNTLINSAGLYLNYGGSGARTGTIYFYADDSVYSSITQESTVSGRLILTATASGSILLSSITKISDTTDATNTTTGCLVLSGGLGIAKTIWSNGALNLQKTDATPSIVMGNTVMCTNLNADLLDGNHAAAFATASHTQAESTITFTDITTGDVSTSAHGYCPKAPNDTAKYLRGDGTWATVTGGVDSTAIHKATASEISAITAKTPMLDADYFLIEDSADSNNKKSATRAAVLAGPINNTDTTDSTSTITGAIKTAGGLGVAKSLNVGGPVFSVNGYIPRFIKGLILSNSSKTGISVGSGACSSDTGNYVLKTESTITKVLANSANWSAGTGGNGNVVNEANAVAWYHVWFMLMSDGSYDVGFKKAVAGSAPAAPTGTIGGLTITASRYIGSFKNNSTNTTASILAFIQHSDIFVWYTPPQDVANFTILSTRTLHTISVPLGVNCEAFGSFITNNISGTAYVYLSDGDAQDQAPTNSFKTCEDNNTDQGKTHKVITDTSGRFGSRVDAGSLTGFYWNTLHYRNLALY